MLNLITACALCAGESQENPLPMVGKIRGEEHWLHLLPTKFQRRIMFGFSPEEGGWGQGGLGQAMRWPGKDYLEESPDSYWSEVTVSSWS